MRIVLVMLCLLWATTALAESEYLDDSKIPAEIKPFILPGTRALALEAADLNGDNLKDYLLVLEKPGVEEGQRPLLIIVRTADGKLKLAKRNDKVVFCSTCGGMMGDPFQGVRVSAKSFTVDHYGGSGWRWSTATTFNYSRRDKTWQLVMVRNETFHAGDPEKVETTIHKPPRDFGKIDIADFDPENYLKNKNSHHAQ